MAFTECQSGKKWSNVPIVGFVVQQLVIPVALAIG